MVLHPVVQARQTRHKRASHNRRKTAMIVTPNHDRTLRAAGAIGVHAVIIGYTDNHVRVIAAEAGLRQFHAVRGAMALALLVAAGLVPGVRLRAVQMRAVRCTGFRW